MCLVAASVLSSCGGGGGDKPNSGPYTPPANVAVSSVSVSPSTSELVIGSTVQLSATVSPSNATDKSVTWSSSNQTVATVTPTGLVTAKAEGSANITANASGKTAVCKVTVKKPTVAVTSVELDQTDITINKGTSQTLKATVKPDNATDKTVTWASSKTDIATVDATGKVTAVAKGVATITASCGGKTATCKVTVTVPVESISLSETTLTLTEGDTKTLVATVKPDDASVKTVEWTSSNTSAATVDGNGKVTAIAVGTTNIAASCGGKTATCKVTVTAPVALVVFDDLIFKSYCISHFDKDNDHEISLDEAKNIKKITVNAMEIKSLKGIENFSNLLSLYCSENHISTLNLSGCPDLGWLECNSNEISKLDLSSCPNMKGLYCNTNKLKELDVSRCPNIVALDCGNNEINSFNIKGCKFLETINCCSNHINSLDLSECNNLYFLYCNNNNLTTLDVSKCPYVSDLKCENNNISNLNISGCNNIYDFNCSDNKITKLDLAHCTSLSTVRCYNNSIETLVFGNCSNLSSIYANDNLLKNIDITNCEKLQILQVQNNQLTSLVLPGGSVTVINSIYCYNNKIVELDLTKTFIVIEVRAWPMPTLKTIKAKTSYTPQYCDSNGNVIVPSDYGTELILI